MSKNLKSWVLLLILACIWGSSFMLMKKGMFTENGEKIFSALQMGNLRILIDSSILLPLSLYNLKKIKNKKQLLYLCIVGFCGNFFPAFLFTYAETEVSSGFAGMLNSFTPIFTLVLGFLLFSNRMTKFQVVGTIIGTIGIYFLITSRARCSLLKVSIRNQDLSHASLQVRKELEPHQQEPYPS